MTDNLELQHLPGQADTIAQSMSRSSLIARGRKDAESLILRGTDSKPLVAIIYSADCGDADAQFSLGIRYYRGEGVSKDYVQAAHWFRKAADQGHADGQWNLGWLYFEGQGLPKNYTEAARWTRKAAGQGNQYAQYQLGWRFNLGRGLPQDYTQAAVWFQKAAEQGNAAAQLDLGWLYYAGRGVSKNYEEAYFWLVIGDAGILGPRPPRNGQAVSSFAEKLTPIEMSKVRERAKEWLAAHPQHLQKRL